MLVGLKVVVFNLVKNFLILGWFLVLCLILFNLLILLGLMLVKFWFFFMNVIVLIWKFVIFFVNY